ncbi:PREDICTED: trypsin 3A1-like [Rhagoletis zephyria]|uniref:trypsin 3A1-like n=1 Tax=Rhagoletis zephyria TaxID=28612 RepID=UPI000811296B|nr:PREDICTED: trypsin 3A1-like [Rhagoletis zephyria]
MANNVYLSTILVFIIIVSVKSDTGTTNTTLQPEQPGGRIVGGYDADIYQFPYQVSVQLERLHRCGGAVYTSTIIVSAAHCVELADMPELYAVRAGSTEHGSGGVYMPVRRILRHAQFQPQYQISHDIALLALAFPLPFGISIQPIPLATRADMTNLMSTIWFVSGWGATSEGSQVRAERLRYVAVKYFDQSYCKATLASAVSIAEGMLCAGVPGGGRDSCQGDSGGPLVGYWRGRLILVGIVSFGVGCGRANYPGIYTRVAEYKDWIELASKTI